MKKIRISILLMMLLFPVMNVNAAGTASITANSSVTNGNNVTATVTLKNMAAWNIQISGTGATNGCSVKQVGDSGNGQDTTKSFTLTCKATKIGTITFSYNGDITSSDGTNRTVSGSKTVNVVKPRDKSNNNNLSGLSVDGYSLSPEFNKEILEYTVILESNIEKININANKEDNYASISGTGEKEVQEGNNKFEIIVTSETGKSKTYTINAIVEDSNPIEKVIDGKRYTIVKRSSALVKPEFFEETTVIIQEIEIPAFYNETTKITLVGLKDQEGNIYLYRYDLGIETYQKFESLTSTSKTIIFENSKEGVDGYTKTTVTIDNQEYTAYQSKINKDYLLIYGVDIETGNRGWYLYHAKEQTIQTYMSDIIKSMNNDFNKRLQEYKIVLLGMSGLSLFLLFIMILQIISKNKLNKKYIKIMQTKKEIKEDKEKLEENQKEIMEQEENTENKTETEVKKNTSKKNTSQANKTKKQKNQSKAKS